MAKVIDLFPKMNAEGDGDFDFSISDIFQLIRDALNGNKMARDAILSFLDFYEKHQDTMDELLYDHGYDDDFDYDDDGLDRYPKSLKVTLRRKDVKEYHIRVKLLIPKMNIWREVKVPSNITLEALAYLLLNVMGWDLSHMFCFRTNNTEYCSKAEINESFSPGNLIDYSKCTISDVLTEKGVRMKLEYDYGDSWMHEVWVKGIREYEPREKHSISFVDGHGACPPDDCGGVPGYMELIELLQKKRLTKDEREHLDWYGISNPAEFNIDLYDSDNCEMYAEMLNDLLHNKTK